MCRSVYGDVELKFEDVAKTKTFLQITSLSVLNGIVAAILCFIAVFSWCMEVM